jgi:hypothetical protein
MISAMEHALWWERARRQQAEEDVGTLLAAVSAERQLAGSALQEAAGAVRDAQVRGSGWVAPSALAWPPRQAVVPYASPRTQPVRPV